MKGVVLVYAGLITVFIGVVSLFMPLQFLNVNSRMTALALIPVGAGLVATGALLPAPSRRIRSTDCLLDDWMPEWQFDEFHSIRIRSTAEIAYRAVREVTAEEIFLFRTLTWIRNPRFRSAQPEHILNAPRKKAILDVALAGGFRLLTDDPPHEIVVMTVVISEAVAWHDVLATDEEWMQQLTSRPGNAVAAFNFRISEEENGLCRVSTETRIFASDSSALRRFAAYWRVIYPGSSLLRYTWLRAIRRRAERANQ